MSEIRAYTFIGSDEGPWRVTKNAPVVGESLKQAPRLSIADGILDTPPAGTAWMLRGVSGHERYATRREHELLASQSPLLRRAEATCAALIPIRKAASWWCLAQDERRAIFEDRSKHIKVGMEYIPAVARRLHHSRDLREPFDFLAWFEYSPAASMEFEELVGRLRKTEEWKYVEREIDIRLVRETA